MRLVFVIKSLNTLGGGAERVFVDVVNELHRRGQDISVLTFEPASLQSFYPLDEAIRRIEPGSKSDGKLAQLAVLPALRRRIVEHAPDLVVAFMPSAYVPVSAALAGSGIGMIASEHNMPERYRRQPGRWLSMLAASTLVQKVTAVSEQMRTAYPRFVRNKMVVLPNPISVAVTGKADVAGRQNGGVILAAGRLHPQKDHLTLIRAFAAVAESFPDWTLRILGDGDERQRLTQEIDRSGLRDRVQLPGTVQEMSSEYRAAQIYVISSRYESLGMATVEALAHGLPAVGFADCPGTNELIETGVNGVLVEPGNDRVGALAGALRTLMASPAHRLALAASAGPVAGKYALSSVVDQWEKVLEAAIGRS